MYSVGFLEFIDVVLDEVGVEAVGGGCMGTVDVGVDGVVAVGVALDDSLGESTGDEMAVAVDAVHLLLPLVEFFDQLVGCEGLVLRDDGGENVLNGIGFDKALCDCCRLGLKDDFLRHVVVVDIESALELVIAGNSLDSLDDGCRSAVGDAEDAVCDGENPFSDIACCAFGPAEQVIGDAKHRSLVEIEVFPEHEIEIVGVDHAALGSEVVEVIEDDDSGLELFHCLENVVMYTCFPFIECPEVVETHKLEIAVIEGRGDRMLDVLDDAAACIGVNPEDSARGRLLLSLVPGDLEGGHGLVLAVDDGCCQHLGEGMCSAVGGSGCEGDFVLVQNGRSSDVDDGMGPVLLEGIKLDVEAEVRPGVVINVLCNGLSIVMHNVCFFNG